MSFQKSILIIALIFLVIILVLIGYGISQTKKTVTWPDQQYQCPDYFPYLTNVDINGTDISGCFNKYNLGHGTNTIAGLKCNKCLSGAEQCFNCSANEKPVFDVSYDDGSGWTFKVHPPTTANDIQNLFINFPDNASYCDKYSWAHFNNVSWDSVTYGTQNPGYDSNGNACPAYTPP